MLTNYLAKSTNVPKSLHDLNRVKATEPQVGKTASQRKKNLSGAFKASQFFVGKHIILIDDVWTTGSTAAYCAKKLKTAGALQVHALALAYVSPNGCEE